MTGMSKSNLSVLVLMILVFGTGCAEAVAVVGNSASMVVACALLWSTVNLGKGKDD